MSRLNIITKGDGFTAISVPAEWYRGYKIEQTLNGSEVLVYDMSGDRPKVVWNEMNYSGNDGFALCRQWLDVGMKYSVPSDTWKVQYKHWLAAEWLEVQQILDFPTN